MPRRNASVQFRKSRYASKKRPRHPQAVQRHADDAYDERLLD